MGLKKTTRLGAKASGGGKLSYSSSNPSVVTVSSKGVIKGLKLGTAKITITAAKTKHFKAGSTTVTVKVKYENPLAAKARKAKVKVSATKVAKADVVLASNVKLVDKGVGTVSYANVSKGSVAKSFAVNAKTGKVSVPSGTAKGTYAVKIKVRAKGSSKYLEGSKTVSYKVVVK